MRPWMWPPTLPQVAGSYRRRFLAGAFWSVVATAALRGATFLALSLAARGLAADQFGALGYAQATVSMLGSTLALGAGMTATRYLARLRHRHKRLAGGIIVSTAGTSLMVGVAGALFCALASGSLARSWLGHPELTGPLRAASLLLVFQILLGALGGILAGLEAFALLALANAVGGIATLGGIAAGLSGGDATSVIFGLAAGQGLACAVAAGAVSHAIRRDRLKLSVRAACLQLPALWSYGLPVMLSSLVTAPVYWLLSSWLAGREDGLLQVGILHITEQWYLILSFFPVTTCRALLPVLTDHTYRTGRPQNRILLRCMAATSALVILPAAIVLPLAPQIMSWYGQQYAAGVSILRYAVVAAGLMAASLPLGQALLAWQRPWLAAGTNVLWAGLYLSLAWHWLGRGAEGVAGAKVVAYAAHWVWTSVLVFSLAGKARRHRPADGTTVPPVLEAIGQSRQPAFTFHERSP